ncbi:hypothetical protein CDAR_45371 [Caerostris darwini]|uniref:Uncharacterized protein n=1 Tax=Caerostris darwini TaxID=1538125 RepID=A0AAV4SUT3_9ARAC|nr:hypothetical protein CDAR_45371 [Caerostris darwini]
MKPRAISKLPRFKLKKVDSFATNNCENSVLQKEFAHLPPRSPSDLPDQHSIDIARLAISSKFDVDITWLGIDSELGGRYSMVGIDSELGVDIVWLRSIQN